MTAAYLIGRSYLGRKNGNVKIYQLLNCVMGQADTAADQFTDGARNRDLVSTRTTVMLSPSLIHSVSPSLDVPMN